MTEITKKIEMNWENSLSIILTLLENGNYEGKKTAIEELLKMAKAADAYNASLKEE